MRRKKRNDDWEDDWTSDFDDFFGFGYIDEHFERMRRYMDRLFKEVMRGEIEPGRYGPFVYGFTARIGPDGKPHIEEFGNTRPYLSPTGEREFAGGREPLTDVTESEDEIYITVELPGVTKNDINLHLNEKHLTIDVDTPKRKYYKEIEFKTEVEPDSARATYKNGVLDLTLRKRKEKTKKGKRIIIE